jgi:hypothetical protein
MSGWRWRMLGLTMLLIWSPTSGMAEDQLEVGRRAVSSLAGCFLVDYSYVETDGLQPGYVRDPRIYDVNRGKSVKEWIWLEPLSEQRLRLQRVLFATDLEGALRPGSVIRHQSEDWEYAAPFLYEFVAPRRWQVRDMTATPGAWTRRVTNLDDGLRHQCAAPWRADTAYPEWSCSNYAPIPGRETRDMGRSDYQTLDRTTRIVAYGPSWLERQDNVKTVDGPTGRVPLARETGKNWYVRLPDAECAAGRASARPRQAFWALLRETWDEVLTGREPFVERTPAGQPPRFVKLWEVEADYLGHDLCDPHVRHAARERILSIIEAYRER